MRLNACRAKQYIMHDHCNCRGFENCWEMFDDDEVLADLCREVRRDPAFRAACLRNRRFMCPELLTACAEPLWDDLQQTLFGEV